LDFIKSNYGAPNPLPFYCSVDPEKYYPESHEKIWDLGYMGTYSDDRQPGLEELLIKPARQLSEKNFVVAGPQYPAIEWPENTFRIEHLAPDQHVAFYNSQRYTLNITRADMKMAGYSPSVRLFEAAACATPIISDYWKGIETILTPGEEILIARESKDVIEMLRNQSNEQHMIIGESARKKILDNHTGEHRAKDLENYIEAYLNEKSGFQSNRNFRNKRTRKTTI
jgi:spore maturation protein CgeB